MKRLLLTLPLLVVAVSAQRAPTPKPDVDIRQNAVQIKHDAAKHEYTVDVMFKPFTAYAYGPQYVDKPIFYPVMSPNGVRVNREFPMVKGLAGESSDHPHHQSLFFTYDEVNGTNFWNPTQTGRRIEHVSAKADGNRLTADLAWRGNDGTKIFDETKRVTFGGDLGVFWMDHDLTLKAAVPVTMGDTKEGAFGLRLNDALKEQGGTGRFINAEGLETEKNVWGKTSAWVAIRGSIKDASGDKPVTVAIFAHPAGLNAPPYWHARAYGLFSANPFARKGYDPAAPERITRLAPGESIRLGFRLAVYSGQVEKARLDQDYAAFKAQPLR